jgi:hypothetical protein
MGAPEPESRLPARRGGPTILEELAMLDRKPVPVGPNAQEHRAFGDVGEEVVPGGIIALHKRSRRVRQSLARNRHRDAKDEQQGGGVRKLEDLSES